MMKRETVLVEGAKTVAKSFDMVLEFLEEMGATPDMLDFIADRKDKANTKSGSKKETDRQKENKALSDVVRDYLVANPNKTISEIISGVPELAGLSTQRVAPIVRGLDGVAFSMDKKSKRYYISNDENGEEVVAE